MIIAIQPDNYTNPSTPDRLDASSPLWAAALQKAGHEVRWVNVYHAGLLDQLAGCHGFMWRWGHFGGMAPIARRLIPVVEKHLRLAVYPNWNTCWHYDDKVTQAWLLPAAGIPSPKTWVWFEPEAARTWARRAQYPLVLKLSSGAGSNNVTLVRNFTEASDWIYRLFSLGAFDLTPATVQPWGWRRRLRGAVKSLWMGRPLTERWPEDREWHKSYVLFQEFLPANGFDTRVTVIGNRAFAFRRFNRDNDFRASGSGKIDWNPEAINLEFIKLAFSVADKLQTQSVAIDGLYQEGKPAVLEISYTYSSWAVQKCSGHWDRSLRWNAGSMWPEDAQVEDYMVQLANP
jgi:hypothetical protein